MKELIIEDFTLILSRNCNLNCIYCPLEHFKWEMSNDIIKLFFEKLLKYKWYKFYITLFWGEPLINRRAIKYIYSYLIKNKKIINNNNLLFEIKIVTNGTLIDKDYLTIFEKFNEVSYINFIMDISIDGVKNTQLSQRNYKIWFIDYYDKLIKNINYIINKWIKVDLFLVMYLHNKNIINDILYLIKNFDIPIFLMPVDLSYDYIIKNRSKINFYIKFYLRKISEIILFIKKYHLEFKISNFRTNSFFDLKLPPIWPTINYNWDIYVTRDFLFQMDKNNTFSTIWNITTINFEVMLDYFSDNLKFIEKQALYTYYGRSYNVNKKIWDYFTNLIFEKINENNRYI